MQSRLESLAPATAQKNIILSTLQQVAIALPPAVEQIAVVTLADELLSVATHTESQIHASVARSSRLGQSILKRAFEGKLVPRAPNDEPASELLERIGAEREEDEEAANLDNEGKGMNLTSWRRSIASDHFSVSDMESR